MAAAIARTQAGLRDKIIIPATVCIRFVCHLLHADALVATHKAVVPEPACGFRSVVKHPHRLV